MSFKAGTYRIEQLIASGIMEIGDGYRAKNSELSDQGVPFARAANINNGFKFDSADLFPFNSLSKVGNKISRPGDVVFTSKGTVGRFALVSEQTQQFVYSPQLCFWRSLAPSKLLPEYLYYWMNSAEFLNQVGYLKGQTDMADYVSLRDQRKITATIPDTADQKEIVEVMKPLDDRIALLRETNATLEAIAQALFKSWFVDFDPVHAKQQGRTSEGAVQGGTSAARGRMPEAALDEATAALFPDSFEESELGLVPKGWRIGMLGDIAQTSKRQIQSSELNADHHYIGLEHIPRKSLSLSDWGNAQGLESAKSAFAEGDILFGKLRPYFHKVVIAPLAGVCSTDILVCQPVKPIYFGVAAMHLSSVSLIDYADRLSNGAKMPRINWKDLAAYPICIPPEPLAKNFNDAIKPLISRMMANVHQAQTLATLRDTLLPRLISGQLRLPDDNASHE